MGGYGTSEGASVGPAENDRTMGTIRQSDDFPSADSDAKMHSLGGCAEGDALIDQAESMQRSQKSTNTAQSSFITTPTPIPTPAQSPTP